MRRLLTIAMLLTALVSGGAATLGPAGAADQRPPEDPRRGVIYAGLRQAARDAVCRGKFELERVRDRLGRPLCTHGPDPAPPGVDVKVRRQPVGAASTPGAPTPGVAAQPSFLCDGDGTSGYRVQLIYAHASDVADRYGEYASSFLQWAANADGVVNNSAAETGGTRHFRFVHDASCTPIIARVTLSSTGDDDFDSTVNELYKQGYNRTDRKYLVWVDATVYCGIGHVFDDDRASSSNYSNGNPLAAGEVGRVDAGCWGQPNAVEAHELMHTLGGVQTSAPHSTQSNHCYDEYDRMCYYDGTGPPVQYLCPSPSHENLYDCNHDDYFNTAPAPNSYLATHWNTANNAFLIGAGSANQTVPPPTTSTVPPPTTTTTTLTTTTTTIRTTTTTRPSSWGVPSAPRNLAAHQPSGSGATGVVLTWVPPVNAGSSPVSGYNVYRGTSSTRLSLLASGVTSTSYADTSTTHGKLYYYAVTAVNASGEGSRSTTARMIAK